MSPTHHHLHLYTSLVLVLLACCARHVTAQTGPNFCTWDVDKYTCDYTSMVTSTDRPIAYTGFSQAPQRLKVKINGCFPFLGDTQVFSSDFGSISVAGFDANFPSSLTIDCSVGGSLYFTAGAFNNMSYIQRLEIKNCDTVYVPSSTFAELANLDYFGFVNGKIDGVDPNAMYQLNVEKLTNDAHSFPRNLGKFEVWYSAFAGKVVPPGFLFNWKNLTEANLVGADIETLTSDTFRYNTKLRRIDLSDNLLTAMPSGTFDNLDALADVTMWNVAWTCTCADLWFVPHATSENVTLIGDFMCDSPSDTSVYKYYYDNCVTSDTCKGAPGIVLMDHCYNAWAMTAICTGFVAMVITIVCLVLVCMSKKQAAEKSNRRVKAKGRWNKVMDSSLKAKMSKLKGLVPKK